MSQIKKLINQKFLEGIDSTKFHVAQNGAIMAKDSSGSMVEFLKVNSDNKGVVLGKVISTKDEIDQLISDLASEVSARQAGDLDAKAYADQKIADLVNGAPALLDTLKELADAIGNDENFAVTIASQIGQLQIDLAAEIARAQAAETALEQRLDAVEPKVTILEGEMDEAQGDILDLEVRITTAENDINAAEGRLNALEPKVSTLETEMDEAQADIGLLEGRMTTAESDIQLEASARQAANTDLLNTIKLLSNKNFVRAISLSDISLSGEQTIDGVSVKVGDRVLVAGQADQKQNGIYVCASGAWSRSLDADSAQELIGAMVLVDEGSKAGTLWYQSTPAGQDVMGSGQTYVDMSTLSYPDQSGFAQAEINLRNGGAFTVGQDKIFGGGPRMVTLPLGTSNVSKITAPVSWINSASNLTLNSQMVLRLEIHELAPGAASLLLPINEEMPFASSEIPLSSLVYAMENKEFLFNANLDPAKRYGLAFSVKMPASDAVQLNSLNGDARIFFKTVNAVYYAGVHHQNSPVLVPELNAYIQRYEGIQYFIGRSNNSGSSFNKDMALYTNALPYVKVEGAGAMVSQAFTLGTSNVAFQMMADVNLEQRVKDYADNKDALKLAEAKDYADAKVLEEKGLREAADAQVLVDAKAYTDSEMASEEAARIQGDADTLQSSKDYTDAEVLEEKNRAMGVEGELRSDLDQEIEDRIDAIAQEVSDRNAAILVEKERAEGAEAGLQSAIDVEKGRVDAILDASQADKDSFAEIVSLINSVDLENDNALASIILAEQTAREEADAALDARLDIVEPKVSTLETGLAQELIDRAAGDAANLSRIETLEGFAVAQTIYVSKNGNDTTGTGGQHKPFLTLTKAFAMITDASPTKRYVVRVAAGAYTEASVALPSNVFVIGEQKETVRITGAVSMGAWTQDNSGSDDRSGFSMVTLLSAANFNWQTAKSRAGKLYMNEVVFGSTLNLYGYDNAIAQAQFDSCVIFNAVTISGINVGVFSNNVCYNNVTLNQHPNGGMASILAASGGYCSGTVRFNTTVNDFGRRSSGFLRAFPSENLIVDGSSSYADVDLISQGKSSTQKLNSGNLVALNPRISHDIETQMIKPLNTNSHNMGDWGKQWMFNFGYVHASSGSDLYLSSLDSSYDAAGSSAGYGVFIESDGYGLKPNVNGGDINLTTGAVSGTGVRGKIKFDAREIDASSKKITSLADGSASGDAVNKGQLDAEVSRAQVAEGALDGRIDILEAMAFYKESKQVGSGDLSYVELAKEAKPYSIKVFVGRLALHEGQDFSVSVVGGKSRLTWMGDFMVGGAEEIEEGMKLFFEYYC